MKPPPAAPPRFHRFATDWLAAREHELRPTTLAVYRWELTHHLLPFFANKRLDEITIEDVDRYRRMKVREGERSPTSINKTITRLAQILEVGVEYGHRGAKRRARQETQASPANASAALA